MKLKITFENSDENLECLEKDSTIICEVNAYIETDGQKTWDLRPPSALSLFENVEKIESLSLYKNKQNGYVGVCADLDLVDEGMCGCEFTVSKVEEVNDFPPLGK